MSLLKKSALLYPLGIGMAVYVATPGTCAKENEFPLHNGTMLAVSGSILDSLNSGGTDNAIHSFRYEGNPMIRYKHTADPATMVVGDTLWLFTGCDEPGNKEGYHMPNWCVFSTTDMIDWTEYPIPVYADDFKWNEAHVSFAGHPVKGPDGKYYFYSSTNWCGIGVAQADRPEGPYKDILGKPLLTSKDCVGTTHSWACIDPVVFIDDDGQPYIFWGNKRCYYARLNKNMKEIDGEIHPLDLKDFTEAPYVHKANGKYYLTYAAQWPEKIAYAMADSISGPWEYMGVISEVAGNSNTTHPAIVNFKGRDWFFSHIGGLGGGSGSRSVIIEPLYYNSDGTYRYFLYYSGHSKDLNRKVIGVAIADDPAGPFYDYGAPIIVDSPVGHGQQIDVDVFQDPVSGKYFIYWGNGYMAGAELEDNMTSVKENTLTVMTPSGGTLSDYAYREAPYVFYRDGLYYFLWSVDDTGSSNYHIAYGTANSPLGPVDVAENCVILIQNLQQEIYGTGHCSVINIPGTDEWRIIYHRINRHFLTDNPGIHRQVCIDRLSFNPDGTIKKVQPTR